MYIIISPSKTQKPSKSEYLQDTQILYPAKHKKVLAALRKLSKNDIQSKMKLTGELLNQTFSNIKNYNIAPESHAFESFTGLVFKGLKKEEYKSEAYDYIKTHLRILDAFYGILEPGTLIKPYRLDFNTKIGLNLYKHWEIDDYFKDHQIINLASNEFSKMIKHHSLVHIHFRQYHNGTYKNQATYSKQARGKLLDYMIQHKVTDTDAIKGFTVDGYSYHEELSDDHNLYFTR